MANYVHFAAEPVERLVQREIRWGIKPFGAFWFSDESQDGWWQWCIENEYGLDSLRHAHRVSFTADARILLMDTVEALDQLHRGVFLHTGMGGRRGQVPGLSHAALGLSPPIRPAGCADHLSPPETAAQRMEAVLKVGLRLGGRLRCEQGYSWPCSQKRGTTT